MLLSVYQTNAATVKMTEPTKVPLNPRPMMTGRQAPQTDATLPQDSDFFEGDSPLLGT